ncbi:hypothetical protein BDZ91DRAFT_711485 [Kalaharituber pfeilii]|nr:hypothetical protein BDZ91DRAFT_711485 [Kalaharituber pfeilii]
MSTISFSKLLSGMLIMLLNIVSTTASPIMFLPRQLDAPAPDNGGLVIDTEPIPTPTRSPYLIPANSFLTLSPTASELATEGTSTPDVEATSNSWTPRHTLIVAVVISSSLVFIGVLVTVIYLARRSERMRREEVAKRGRTTMASEIGMVRATRTEMREQDLESVLGAMRTDPTTSGYMAGTMNTYPTSESGKAELPSHQIPKQYWNDKASVSQQEYGKESEEKEVVVVVGPREPVPAGLSDDWHPRGGT